MKNFKKMMTLMALCLSVAITTSGYATTLPDIPEPLKNGTGAIDNNGVIYVGLGTAGTSWYKIDLKKQHKDRADRLPAGFPGIAAWPPAPAR